MKIVNKLCSDTLDKYAGDNVIMFAGDGLIIHIPCSLMCPSDFKLNDCLVDNEDCLGLGKCKECFNKAIDDITGVIIVLSKSFKGVEVLQTDDIPIMDTSELQIPLINPDL